MATDHSVHFKTERTDWATPDDLYERLDALYRFDLDVAASSENARCSRHFTVDNCGLAQSWQGARVWCNPPYGRQIGNWTQKASQEAPRCQLIVMLVPARTDTQWWHEAIKTARPIFLKGRLRFKGATASAPFPSALLIWNA
jgi:site-specific DNA-methyltransferase (adenine-specific)